MNIKEFLDRLDKMSTKCRDATHSTSMEPDIWYYNGMAKAFDVVIKDLSKVEFEDRAKGKWIEININPVEFGGYTSDKKCSFCGHITSEYLPKFCSHCGADMRGEE